MEKIIAVVVMIAIVIGLIATAVMPTVQQMNEQGQEATNDLANLSATMSGNSMQGSTVVADIKANLTKFQLTSDKLQTITISGQDAQGNKSSVTMKDATNLAAATAIIPDSAIFIKSTTTYPSGKLKTVTYTIQGL